MTEGIPPGQTVEVGSVWDMRDEPNDYGGWIGLFKVAEIEDDIARSGNENDEPLGIQVEVLANNYLKLTPNQVEKIEAEMKDYHKHTIQPINGSDGKIIQVGSVWDYRYPNEPIDESRTFIVASLGDGDVVWAGPEHQGFGINASTLLENGKEIQMCELPSYYSTKQKKHLEESIKNVQYKGRNLDIIRVFDNGLLVKYEITPSAAQISFPKITYHDREATKEEKEEIEHSRKVFCDWVIRERALATESPHRVAQMTTKHTKISIPILHKIPAAVSFATSNMADKNTTIITEPVLHKHQALLTQSDHKEKQRLRA